MSLLAIAGIVYASLVGFALALLKVAARADARIEDMHRRSPVIPVCGIPNCHTCGGGPISPLSLVPPALAVSGAPTANSSEGERPGLGRSGTRTRSIHDTSGATTKNGAVQAQPPTTLSPRNPRRIP